MYNEFKSLAFDDIARNVSNGFNRLIHFYGSFSVEQWGLT